MAKRLIELAKSSVRFTAIFSVVHHIIGQQISTKTQATIWQKMQDNLDEVNADTILSAGTNRLQSLGMILKKADCIIDLAILHDMRVVYHHRKIACKLFEKYRR